MVSKEKYRLTQVGWLSYGLTKEAEGLVQRRVGPAEMGRRPAGSGYVGVVFLSPQGCNLGLSLPNNNNNLPWVVTVFDV